MGKGETFRRIAFAVVALTAAPALRGQAYQRGATVQGDASRSQGRFLRGMAWYELGTAQAGALETDAVASWNRAVQADYQQYLLEKAGRSDARKALRNGHEAVAAQRL